MSDKTQRTTERWLAYLAIFGFIVCSTSLAAAADLPDVMDAAERMDRMTDGILTQIEQYGGDVRTANTGGAGQISRGAFEDWIQSIFTYNVKGQPNERVAFCGNMALKVINRMAWLDGDYQFKAEETKLGIKITEFVTPFGTLKLMTHAMMNENPVWSKEVYALHPGAIKKRVLRDTFPENYDKHGNGVAGVVPRDGQGGRHLVNHGHGRLPGQQRHDHGVACGGCFDMHEHGQPLAARRR